MVRYVECLFDYDGSPGQLSFRAGHLIEVLTQGDPHEWWEGKLTADDSTGWFPSAYCSAPFDEGMEGDVADDAAADAPAAGARARALYSFEASEDDELSFEAGDVLMVEPSEQAWWTGAIGDARGSFPSNYVEIIDEVPPAGAKPEVDLLGKKLGAALGKKRTPNRDARESDDWDEPTPRDEPPPPPPDGAAASPPSVLGGRHGPPSVIRFEQLPQAEVGAVPREEDAHRTLLEGFIERPVKYDGYAIGARPLWQHLAFTDFFTCAAPARCPPRDGRLMTAWWPQVAPLETVGQAAARGDEPDGRPRDGVAWSRHSRA